MEIVGCERVGLLLIACLGGTKPRYYFFALNVDNLIHPHLKKNAAQYDFLAVFLGYHISSFTTHSFYISATLIMVHFVRIFLGLAPILIIWQRDIVKQVNNFLAGHECFPLFTNDLDKPNHN